jgi:cephalosporin hydroxylase
VVIHRSVLERMREAFTAGEIRPAWYDRLPNPSTQPSVLGEDLSFCVRAGALGFPVFVDTRVKTSHYKHQWVSEEDYIRSRFVQAAVDKPTGSPLPVHVDLEASLESLASNAHVKPDGMLKLDEDLERYRQIIEATKPEVIVETGTRSGASARWFAEQGVDVVTVDVTPVDPDSRHVTAITGDAKDPAIAAKVAELVGGRRCMVSLDSDHSGPHVAEEIKLYGPLVSPGCYLVVEDGIFGYATRTLRHQHGLGEMVGSPLDAIAEHLDGNPDWSRDVAIERLSPVTHHPAGFWIRNA